MSVSLSLSVRIYLIYWGVPLLGCCWVTVVSWLCDHMDCSMLGFPVLHCPGVCLNSSALSQWCCLTVSSSAALFSFCLQSFPASGSFPVNQLFTSGDLSIGASVSASVLPMLGTYVFYNCYSSWIDSSFII